MDNAKSKSDMQEGAYPEKKKKSVAGQFAEVKYGGTWLVTLTVRI